MFLAALILQSTILGTQILMVAVSLYLIATASRIFHLAVGAIGAAAAYVLYGSIVGGLPIWVAILSACLVAVLLGTLSARLLETFAVRRETLLGLLVSFALGIILEAFIALTFGTDGKSLQVGILPVVRLGQNEIDTPGVITIVAGCVLAAGAWASVRMTHLGRLLRSVAENPPLAMSLGVSNRRIRYVAHVASALVAGFVITLAGWHTALTPLMGFHLVIAAFIALLVGGVSDLRGTVVASYLIAIIPSFIIGFADGFSENWRLVFVFCVAIAILSVRPYGIFSREVRTV